MGLARCDAVLQKCVSFTRNLMKTPTFRLFVTFFTPPLFSCLNYKTSQPIAEDFRSYKRVLWAFHQIKRDVKQNENISLLGGQGNEKFKFTHYLVIPMPMVGLGEILESSKQRWRSRGIKTFYNQSLLDPTVKCPKHFKDTNVKVNTNA